MRARLVIEID